MSSGIFDQSCSEILHYDLLFSRISFSWWHTGNMQFLHPFNCLSTALMIMAYWYTPHISQSTTILSLFSQRYLHLTNAFRPRHWAKWTDIAHHHTIRNLLTRIDSFHFSWITFAKFRSIWTTQSSTVSDPCRRKKIHSLKHSIKAYPSNQSTTA